ncbi:NAD-dependent epimerase/dehydratase family protein [Chelativorans salis]|uniref:NAD-dependent epimerase/dehydratase family protein n=1 Tax=Chelativorans salis TaxID=2978478 RepID=A0ABT2LSX7_9HYPH|nr:NAD-dependent epimerase/dehydratase family protein [Chelativorans sp. EGI FJ00035]MCT7376947.1 NAD-dependent epimerase/dehydratase family protein [Chelativorans sp. EGI FJ00035]
MKVLLTGIAGFIGFHTALRLAARGDEIIGVDNLNDYYPVSLKRARLNILGKRARFRKMDIADIEALSALVVAERPDVIVHLAAQAGVRYSLENPLAYARSNLIGHLSVLEACRRWKGLRHLVYASSSSVYGDNKNVPFSEADRVDSPKSLYAATKRSDELMSEAYASLYGLRQIGLRFFTVYGAWGRPDMAYWIFTKSVIEGHPIRMFNNGDMMRDFTHVDDIVSGVVSTAVSPVFLSDEHPHRVYNVGNNCPTKLIELVRLIEQHTGRSATIRYELMQPGDVVSTYADIESMQTDYGFHPTTSLSDGIREFVGWYRNYAGYTRREVEVVA